MLSEAPKSTRSRSATAAHDTIQTLRVPSYVLWAQHDSIWVIVDWLPKMANFLSVHTTSTAKEYVEIYLDRIVCLHVEPKVFISNGGAQFLACFREQLQASLGTKLIRSSAYHP